jgi:DNA repair protein RadC
MILLREAKQIQVRDAAQVAAVFRDLLALEDAISRDTEHYYVMHLDARQTVKLVELVSIGVLNHATVHPRETFRRAVVEGSASIIIAHNHPSGTVKPSDDDARVTGKMHDAGNILGIDLLDHLVFSGDKYFSYRSNSEGVMKE